MQGRIEQEFPLPTDRALRFVAEDIRKERTGIHAKITICIENQMLAFSNFNIERDEDRIRLANSAHKNMGEVERDGWAQDQMRRSLSAFCAGLWDALVGAVEVGPMEGARRTEGMPYLCKPFVIEGGGTIIYAPPGRGKSFSAMLLAVSIDAGENSLFPGVQQGKGRRGLYINIERDKFSMADRLARINDSLAQPEDRPMHFMNQRGKSLADVIGAAEKYVDKHQIEFVVLDSISRSGMGDLNENQPVNRIVDALNGLCRTWVALAHTPRSDESHVYGSMHFDAGMDVGVKLSTESINDGFEVGVALSVTKANDGRVGGRPLMYVLEFNEAGLQGVRQPRPFEFVELEIGTEKVTLPLLVDRYVQGEGAASVDMVVKATKLSRQHVSKYMNESGNYTVVEKRGRVPFYAPLHDSSPM